MTNFERIKKMNAEELAAELSDVVDGCPPSAAQYRAMYVYEWTEDDFRQRFRKSYI